MTHNESIVLEYLAAQPDGLWTSPTQIGNDLSGGKRHSAWASPICKRLTERGYVERNNSCGHYKITGMGISAYNSRGEKK